MIGRGRRLLMALVFAAAVPAAAGAQKPAPPPSAEQAAGHFDAGRYADAVAVYRSLLETQPRNQDLQVRLGWSLYRAGDFENARLEFEKALAAQPSHLDAKVGLGFARLQTIGPDAAAAAFAEALSRDPSNLDALSGMALAGSRPGSSVGVARQGLAAARKVEARRPRDPEASRARLALEARLEGKSERRLRGDADPSRPMRVEVRALRDVFEVRGAGREWHPFFVKGINLGAALPGKFPTEFPEEEATYAAWLDAVAGLGANAIRAYTLLPPAFYRALSAHNASGRAPGLRLIQGVWTELPAGHDFSDAGFVSEFESEIARVVDAVYGDLSLAPRPGHASGVYDTDVSGALLAWIVGREWEPFAVKDYDAMRAGESGWQGRWFRASGGRAMEAFAARICDFTAGYEARRHRALHPVAFANWPTLDPLRHPTESDRAEEDAWRKRQGLPVHAALREPPWEEDAATLDATSVEATAAMLAGTFASYHIYPNFPDFLNLDPDYGRGRDAEGPSRFAAYLRALKAYHGRQPLLVAEFGISTSRGIAHLQPEGWHHGGHDEVEQGRLLARMIRAIRDTGCAGGIVFELIDEWFKGTWSTNPLEIPAERRRLWFNAESPEQSYGLLAARPGSQPIVVDGDVRDWVAARETLSVVNPTSAIVWSALKKLRVASDEGYLYLLLETGGGPSPPDWTRVVFRIGLDTYAPERGERELPAPGPVRTPTGVEFLVEIGGPGKSRVTVSEPYEPHARIDGGPVFSPSTPSGRFVPIVLETNRERFGRDGTRFPAQTIERGSLREGSLDERSPGADTRTDYAIGASSGSVEIRLPWGLLNVADPSSRRVLHQEDRREALQGTAETGGFRVYAYAADPSRPDRPPVSALEAAEPYRWSPWERPVYRIEPKRGAGLVREALQAISDAPRSASPGGTTP